ncbi:MAG: hypothetical protein ACYCST_13140 [Acidimicrobiales bacterium]
MGLSTGGMLRPEDAAEFQQRVIEHCDLHSDVPEETRNSFERLRTLHSYGIFCYEAFTVADDLAWLLLEQALRERFIAFYDGVVPLVHARTGEERPIRAPNFGVVDDAFRSGGTHGKGAWQIPISSGSRMDFRGSMLQLLAWARREHLLEGQRNKRLDPVFVAMRNSVAHPHYHLSMPPDSARTIHDLAEIINRLWGHSTPGGRLYPAPLDRQIVIVAWTEAEQGPTHTLLRDDQLATFTEPGDWTCVVIRAVYDDEGVWEFDAQYERNHLPAELLWGPGSREDALAWINEVQPQADTASYLDRLFAVRIDNGRASLARRPEVALALPPEKRTGRWLLVCADFPNDAFAHGRHVKNGVVCGDPEPHVRELQPGVTATSPPIPPCAIEEMFDGSWKSMVEFLGSRFNITEPATLSDVRVRPRFTMGVASDVEAD